MSQKVKIYKKKIQIWSEDNNWAFDWSHFALRHESLLPREPADFDSNFGKLNFQISASFILYNNPDLKHRKLKLNFFDRF